MQVVKGYIWDVVLDLRQDSPTFKQWQGFYLQDPLLNPNKQLELLYIPEGCAHGFLTISEDAIVHYKVAERYYPQEEQTLVFNDPDIAIEWPLHALPVDIPLILSEKDRQGKTFSQLPLF
ncbi:dTDP-4-dehydrorhamnose 3,5-epimerase family protein [Pelistega indica]|uniref:dTDP-4-dehydrorhamnose 3,5-epimerase family protein n=1 Tax=Pelistega indica TaxID=1414851 RepID=UPI0011C9C852